MLKDVLPLDILETLGESDSSFVVELIAGCNMVKRGKQQRKTVLSRFKVNLLGEEFYIGTMLAFCFITKIVIKLKFYRRNRRQTAFVSY